MPQLGLGRKIAHDYRDAGYSVSPHLRGISDLRYRYWWSHGAWFDQGDSSACVGHSWAHWLEDGPVTQPLLTSDPFAIYHRAQELDEWEGTDYDGSSIRAGAKVCVELGAVDMYLWAMSLDETVYTLLEKGPVVAGTDWFEDMFYPDRYGRVRPTGDVAGGHAWLIDGVNIDRRVFRCKNSWGREWGRRGFFTLGFDDFEYLRRRDGEVCLAVERSKA